jgi:Cu+-exporting ATPase
MNRRKFLCQATTVPVLSCAGASASVTETRVVHYKVKGFTCITCAVGLETMLRQLKGVVKAKAKAAYPENTVAIGFDEKVITETAIRHFIQTCGFAVA